jgi:hypothetical protein
MPKRTHNNTPGAGNTPVPTIPARITRQRKQVAEEQERAGYLPAQAGRIAAWFVPWTPPKGSRQRRSR